METGEEDGMIRLEILKANDQVHVLAVETGEEDGMIRLEILKTIDQVHVLAGDG